MRQKIETAANLVFIAATVILASLFVKSHVWPNRGEASVERGDPLPSIPDYDWKSHKRTLVLAQRIGCHYCENSVPFYRELTDFGKAGPN